MERKVAEDAEERERLQRRYEEELEEKSVAGKIRLEKEKRDRHAEVRRLTNAGTAREEELRLLEDGRRARADADRRRDREAEHLKHNEAAEAERLAEEQQRREERDQFRDEM